MAMRGERRNRNDRHGAQPAHGRVISQSCQSLRGGVSGRHDVDMQIMCITVDCADPRAVASFWNDALDWEEAFAPVGLASH